LKAEAFNLRQTWPRALSPGSEDASRQVVADEAGSQHAGTGG
jgi:hypothetical protein